MKTVKEIRAEIKEHKQYMKEAGIKVMSFMNRHLSVESSRANERLFKLNCDLKNAQEREAA
jgi:hypothetical protein